MDLLTYVLHTHLTQKNYRIGLVDAKRCTHHMNDSFWFRHCQESFHTQLLALSRPKR